MADPPAPSTGKRSDFARACGAALGRTCQTSQTCQTLLVRRPRIIMGKALDLPHDLLFK